MSLPCSTASRSQGMREGRERGRAELTFSVRLRHTFVISPSHPIPGVAWPLFLPFSSRSASHYDYFPAGKSQKKLGIKSNITRRVSISRTSSSLVLNCRDILSVRYSASSKPVPSDLHENFLPPRHLRRSANAINSVRQGFCPLEFACCSDLQPQLKGWVIHLWRP